MSKQARRVTRAAALLLVVIGCAFALFRLSDWIGEAIRIDDDINRCLDDTSGNYIRDYDERMKACGPTHLEAQNFKLRHDQQC